MTAHATIFSNDSWSEIPLLFDCGDARLLGILAAPAQAAEAGVVIVVGGPQYRAGSHRQFTLLARQLAESGIASLRFDHRGMGDSEGAPQGFQALDEDIRAAVDALAGHLPGLRRVALWGLCDAAWAIARYARRDRRVAQVILLNPWLEEPQIEARTRLLAYYPKRIGQSHFWAKLLALDLDLRGAIKGLAGDLGKVYLDRARPPDAGGERPDTGMLAGLSDFAGDILVVTSENDLTGRAFNSMLSGDPRWRPVRERARQVTIAEADHTFSRRPWRDRVADLTAAAVLARKDPEATTPACTLSRFEPAGVRALEAEWLALEAASDSASFFQSWTWIGSWLEALPAATELYCLRIRQGDATAGLALFGKSTQVRRGIVRSRRLSLAETGLPEPDAITIEHNGLLVRSGMTGQVWATALAHLTERVAGWDEVCLAGVSDPAALEAFRAFRPGGGITVQAELSKPYFWVDLDGLRRAGRDYLGSLSANTRQQIRKAMRLYEQIGPIQVTAAATVDEAGAMLGELKALHQGYWTGKGQPGAFASGFANRFHDRLLANGLARGQIQLLRIASGGETIGLLYNFVHRGRVLNYQAGLAYSDNPKLKPGLVCHALAIEYNLARGNLAYDFLMGDSQYKRSLALEEGMMHWLGLKQPRIVFRLEDFAKLAKSTLNKNLPKPRPQP